MAYRNNDDLFVCSTHILQQLTRFACQIETHFIGTSQTILVAVTELPFVNCAPKLPFSAGIVVVVIAQTVFYAVTPDGNRGGITLG